MADCAPLPSPRVNSSRRRKSSRARRSNENAAPASTNLPATPINRFGFKKRANASASHLFSAQEELLYEALPVAPVELVSMMEGALGDLEAYAAIIRTRPVANQYDFKARISEMTDMHKQTKEALKDLVRRGRGLPSLLTTAQEEINARLEAMAQELGTTRASHDHAKRELSSARTRGDELALASQQLQADLLEARAAVEALKPQCDQETHRANTAEAKLSQCEQDLEQATALAAATEKVRAELATAAAQAQAEHEEAATEAARQLAEDSAARAKREAELTAELTELRDEAQSTRMELEGALEESRGRVSELEASLAKLTAEHDEMCAAHAALKTSSAATAQTLAEKESTLIRVQVELEAASSQMEKKDADLRASIQSVMQIQRDNTEQAQNERQRFEKLEDELRSLRDTQQQLQLEKQSALLDGERLQAEITSLNARLQELTAAVHRVESERDVQLARVAEMKATIAVERSTAQKLSQELARTREDLAGERASLKSKSQQFDEVASQKHTLEVEYRSYKEHHGSSNAQQMEAITELKLTVDKLSQQVEHKQAEIGTQVTNVAQQSVFIQSLQAKLLEAEATRRALHNAVQELKGNIRVFCRMRPPPEGDAVALSAAENQLSLAHNAETYNFSFDKVFKPDATQDKLFEEVDGLVQSALDGYKVCIFAYGQTGSGKTHTMQGGRDPQNWGLIPRSLSKILRESELMRKDGWEWTLRASFLEVYNEQLRDLLSSEGGTQSPLSIKHDDEWGTVVTNVSEFEVDSMEQINLLMAKAAKQRAVGCTDMNAASSRSHSVFALYLKGVNEGLGSLLHGALHLVDLAGSERLDRSGATGDRLKETQSINKSLSSLADVFAAKSSRQAHVPFRNSKLTFLMEPCLSGQGKTLMVVNVGPEDSNSHETLCSLRFASQVSQCDTGGKPKRSAKAVAGAGAPKAVGVKSTVVGVAAKSTGRPQSAASTIGPSRRAK